MMTPIQLYSSFCDFIDTYIFSEEKVGMTVSFVVDKTLITEFCKKHNVTESILMEAVRGRLYSYHKDIKHIKGILAIQLYAASKRVLKTEDIHPPKTGISVHFSGSLV